MLASLHVLESVRLAPVLMGVVQEAASLLTKERWSNIMNERVLPGLWLPYRVVIFTQLPR